MQFKFNSAGLTDKGKVRGHNEDAFLNAPQQRLWVVADGMGGHAAGDYASNAIVEQLGKLSAPEKLAEHVEAVEKELVVINAHLQQYAQERKANLVGSTVVVMLAGPEFMVCGWAGDSRIYRRHEGTFQQVTKDHSTLQEMMDTGVFQVQPGQKAPSANAITRAVGGDAALFLDWSVASYESGTQFLLCSDGVTKELKDPEIDTHLQKNADPEQAVKGIVEAALVNGGRDNTTAVVVAVED